MSALASSFSADGFLPRRFWLMSFAIVAGLHLGAGAVAMFWQSNMPTPAEPAAAIMVSLAPIASAPPEPVNEIPPGPEKVAVPPAPMPARDPEPEPLPDLEPEPPVVEKAEVALPPPPPEPKPKPDPEPERAPEPEPVKEPIVEEAEAVEQTTAPTSLVAAPDEVAAAPVEGAPSLSQSARSVSWQSALLGRLERFKRYPPAARRMRREGVVYIRFTMDRQGSILAKQIEESSGATVLDQEVLDLLSRAEPLPPPPPDVKGEAIELVVPVEFYVTP